MNWDKSEIINEQGELVFAQTPIIVSASRWTGIPTFYAGWFVDNHVLRKIQRTMLSQKNEIF